MIINGRTISSGQEPYVIAELSANHGGSIERAKQSIKAAADCGVAAVKIQTYTPDTMTIASDKPDFKIKGGLWDGYSLYDLYGEAYTPFEWHRELFEYASRVGITLFSTPFDESAVDLLESLNTPAYKIASFELTDLPLIRYVAKQNKPMLLSTGMGSLEEIEEAIQAIRAVGDNDILLFHCISSYPAPTEDSNLANLTFMKDRFGVEVGLSDHTTNNLAAIMAMGLGAVAIEKHFKLDEDDCGPDASFSLTPGQLRSLVQDTRTAWLAAGTPGFHRPDVEGDNLVFRRSLYFVRDLKGGETITESHVRRIRPGYGLKPKYQSEIIGRTVVRDVERGEAVTWSCLSGEPKD